MVRVGLFVKLEARAGKEAELAGFLGKGLELANQEQQTPVWFAVRFGPSTFAIFDAFADESGRKAHLEGPIAAALMAKAGELLAQAPAIERCDVIGAKLPG
jgi:quinol monooxygenase YgiN